MGRYGVKMFIVAVTTLLGVSMFAGTAADKAKKNKVIIIGVDGCRTDAMKRADAPVIHSLIKNGAYSYNVTTDRISSSGPCWASILTGVWDTKHNVIDNDFKNTNFKEYPDIFTRMKKADPNIVTASAVSWLDINEDILNKKTLDYSFATDDKDDATTNYVVDLIDKHNPDAIFVQLNHVDHIGHKSGFSPDNPEYMQTVKNEDARVGKIINAICSRKSYDNENWLIIVTPDHGGTGPSHGGMTNDENTVWFTVVGDDVKRGLIAKRPGIVDVAALALKHMNTKAEHLDGSTDDILVSKNNQNIKPLPFLHSHNDYVNNIPLFDALNQGFTSIEADVYLWPQMSFADHGAKFISTAIDSTGKTFLQVHKSPSSDNLYYSVNSLGKGPSGNTRIVKHWGCSERVGALTDKYCTTSISGNDKLYFVIHKSQKENSYYYQTGTLGKDYFINWTKPEKIENITTSNDYISCKFNYTATKAFAVFNSKDCKNYYISGDISDGKIKWTEPKAIGSIGNEYISLGINKNGSKIFIAYKKGNKYYYQFGNNNNSEVSWTKPEEICAANSIYINSAMSDDGNKIAVQFYNKTGNNYKLKLGKISGEKVIWTDSVDVGKACSEYASFAMSGNGSNTVLMYADKHLNYQYHVINIESDYFALDNGSCCVSHDVNGITLSDTLAALYLKPLQRRAKLFGGKIFPDYNKPIRLLVDVKNPFHGSIEILNRYLATFKDIIWAFNNKTGKANDNPVKIVLSGYNGDNITQNDINYLLSTPERFVSVDGRIDNPLLRQDKHPELFPLVSDSWKDKYENSIDHIVIGLHQKGEKVRFWGTDDTPKVWKYLQSHKVDVISTDKLKEIRQYFK